MAIWLQSHSLCEHSITGGDENCTHRECALGRYIIEAECGADIKCQQLRQPSGIALFSQCRVVIDSHCHSVMLAFRSLLWHLWPLIFSAPGIKTLSIASLARLWGLQIEWNALIRLSDLAIKSGIKAAVSLAHSGPSINFWERIYALFFYERSHAVWFSQRGSADRNFLFEFADAAHWCGILAHHPPVPHAGTFEWIKCSEVIE